MEDDLKTLIVQYLGNHWLDHTEIYNLVFGDQTKLDKFSKKKQTFNKRQPQNIFNILAITGWIVPFTDI